MLLLIIPIISFSQQYQNLDSFALNIPDSQTSTPQNLANYIGRNYTKKDQMFRILYVWITNEIKYEKEIIDTLKNEDLVLYALKTKSGKCKNYSALLTSLCDLLGIEAYSVLGYVKIGNIIETQKDHAWNIVKLDDNFYLFDPTWDANLKQYDSINYEFQFLYYKQSPDVFINTHIPYDPMMQLSNYPLSHKDFFLNKLKGKKYFNFKEALLQYKQLDEYEKLSIMLKRAEDYEIDIPELEFLYKRLKYFVNKTLGKI
jgi:transglutaminase/protease-like cytokinesis protein 3